MAWTWRYETADGAEAAGGTSQQFPTQADAETWIGESWQELLGQGVDQVSLLEDERVPYGPMGLRPA